ncbi:MAG: 4-alpha-glucanotransferase [Deltaproteobacteria bacterium]|jgi:4-alpha-glucanotransferase|nr:4-alpha-glucanotransferase [Deltaproteobacteria bacterium]
MVEQEKVDIEVLATAFGIQPSYSDIWGNTYTVAPETLELLLGAMGVDVSNPREVLRDVEHRAWNQLAPPVLVVSINQLPADFLFQVPSNSSPGAVAEKKLQVRLEITGENTSPINHSYHLEQLNFKKDHQLDDITYECWSFPFPTALSTGYYHFKLTVAYDNHKHQQTTLVAICPGQAYLPPALQGDGKRAGIAISLYGLRSQHNWGVGDFGDLKEFIRWAIGSLHVDVIGLNPLHAIPNRQPYNISPYFPSSRFYRNYIYLDIAAMEDFRSSPAANEFVQAAATQNLLADLRASELVQYERVATLKLQVLERVFQTFLDVHWLDKAGMTEHSRQFQAYLQKETALLDYFATFCALEDSFRQKAPDAWAWRQWPEPFQNPASQEVQEFQQNHWQSILFHKYLQWQVEEQLKEAQDLAQSMGASVGLYHDLALGSDPGGADNWAYSDFFVPGVTVGAPPDDFALEGQDWGFHPPHREKYRSDGYSLFVQEIRKNCQAAGALRIDHIMRFFRLFWIIQGQRAKNGTYVEDYYQDLLKILALESDRAKTLIIGEDLGTVPPQVRDVLAYFRIFSYRLFYFERDDQGGLRDPGSYPPYALAAVSTHDLPTLAGFWTGEDLSLRNSLGLFPSEDQFHAALQRRTHEKEEIVQRLTASGFLGTEVGNDLALQAEISDELHSGIIGFLLSTPAKLVVISQEDLFRDTRQQNVPGTVTEHSNWSTKMNYTLEELWQDPEVEKYVRVFRQWVSTTGRGMSPYS